jgi:hypothetical protein
MNKQQPPTSSWQEKVESLYRDRIAREARVFVRITLPSMESLPIDQTARAAERITAHQLATYLDQLQELAIEHSIALSEVVACAVAFCTEEGNRLLSLETA